jgi:hypothetical protein
MKRREFVQRVGMGSAAIVSAAGVAGAAAGAQKDEGHDHRPIEGSLASATVSFGQWPATGATPLDRTVLPTAPAAPNVHLLIPQTAIIRAGGSVNFIVAGFHQIAIYAPGTKPTDINTTVLIPIPGAPPTVGLIDDPTNRLYRGLSPLTQPQDRVEVVHFSEKGLYLVVCLVSPHFINDNMYGWVRVLR